MISVPRFFNMIQEMEHFYENLDTERDMLRALADDMHAQHKHESAFVQKTELIRILAEKSTVHVFRYYPFWFQFSAGRIRKTWGGFMGLGAYLHNTNGGASLQAFSKAFAADREQGFVHNWNNPVGLDHHALHYEMILKLGLSGLREQVRAARAACTDEAKFPFYNAAEETLNILCALSRRFADRAEKMLETETDTRARENLKRVAEAAKRVPEQPPQTFYEALAAIVFCRECVGTLEGIGVSTYGRLDLLLQPYYAKDIADGTLTEAQAVDLIEQLLLYTAVRFDENNKQEETSTTIVLGGCDADGNPVYNEVTKLILRAEKECRVANVKLDARVSKAHPAEYIEELCKVQAADLPVLVFMNDDTHIAARVKYGQDIRDVRDYVAGGCHEYVLGGTEMCTRADTWINLPRILLETMRKKTYDSFEALYSETIADVRAYHEKLVAAKNAFEVHWVEYNPMPLYSTMTLDCVAKGIDITAGGARYSSTALSMMSPATFVDSLYTVKTLCFDEKRLTLTDLLQVLDHDFAGNEELHDRIVRKLPKYGSGNEALDAFSAQVLHDLSGVSGQTNGRGGKYYPAFYAHDVFRALGERTGATPDGRKKGTPMSRGASPSEFLSNITPTEILRSAAEIDFTDFTDSFALEITLPVMNEAIGVNVLKSLVNSFLEAGGSTLQFNMLNTERLLEAQKHPEQHRDLLVRVCGYSYYFVNLAKNVQDEVIARTIRRN